MNAIRTPEIEGRVVYWNGRFVPETEARLSIYDSALMFGDAVFEMTRTFNGTQFKLREHLLRLEAGLRILHYPKVASVEEMEQAVHATVEANAHLFAADDEHRVMITVTRGLLGIYQGQIGLPAGPNLVIADYPLRWTVAGMGPLFDGGVNLVVPSQRAIPATYLDPKIKNRSRIHYQVANIEASKMKGENNWAILLDERGRLTEGTGANLFLVSGGRLLTPPGNDVLRGISRAYVMEDLAPALGLPVEERTLELYDLHRADEAFMTATPFCILPATTVQGLAIGDGKPGPVTSRLLQAWSDAVGVDIPDQIKAWQRQNDLGESPTTYAFRSR